MKGPVEDSVSFAKALADPTRQKIMRLLCCQWLNVTDVVEQLDVSQPTVSHHLSILKSAGLVTARREGKQIFYTLDQKTLTDNCCQLVDIFAPGQKVVVIKAT